MTSTQQGCNQVAADGFKSVLAAEDRRIESDRRTPSVGSVVYGLARPRRRAARRASDAHGIIVDWHHPRLLYMTLGILVLSTADAVLTLNLLQLGATEINPVMDKLIQSNVQAFANAKMAVTGVGLVALVTLSNFRVFRGLRVSRLLDFILLAYLLLVGYELWLLRL